MPEPWFAAGDRGLVDFAAVCDAHYDEILAQSTAAIETRPDVAPIVAGLAPEARAEEQRRWHARFGAAVAGDWDGYERDLRARGDGYARLGMRYGAWHELLGAFQEAMLALLVGAYGGEPARLTAALQALQRFGKRTLVVLGESYISASDALLAEQHRVAERNEERYRMLFDNGPVPMWVYDVETLEFLAVNRAAVEHYGFSEAEFLAMTIEDIRAPEELPKLRAEAARPKSLRGATHLGEWRHRRKNGSAIDVELRLENFVFLGRRAHLIVATDVTERRRAARALAMSEERYRSLVAATSSVVWTADPEGRFVTPQLSWAQYTGQRWEQHGGFGWADALHRDDRMRIMSAWARACATLELFESAGRLWHAPSRAYHWFEVRAVPILNEDGSAREWIGTVSDIDEKKRMEEPGRFFTLSLDLLCIAGMDGYFKRLNPAFAILGYTEAELLGTPILELVHPDDRAATRAAMEQLGRGELLIHFENRYRCKDGSYRHLTWTSAPDPSGMVYAAARDITEAKRVEAERVELTRLLTVRNEDLVRANRAKSDFLAMMSHELRTPLNSIIGFSEVLIDGKFGPLNERQGRYLGNVLQSGRHLLALINDLLDLSKIEAGRLEVVRQPCPTRMLAAEAIATLQPLADARGVELKLETEAGRLPPVMGDAARLKQVLYNLLSNAIKFTPPKGQVRLVCSVGDGGKTVRLAVADTGSGIDPAEAGRLFQPFTQLANARDRGGTGLGLALTKQLVELMGGEIGLESEVGRGSTFWVDLPAETSPSGVTRAARLQPAEAAPLALVVDDDAAARELLVLALQEAGFRVRAATSGEEAIAEVRRQRPAVVTLDVFLPTIDGWDVLRLLKSDAETADVPVVMVSISSDRAKAFSLGAIEHLVKPVGREALLEALARRSFTTKVKQAPVSVLAIDDDVRQLELFRAALEPHGFRVRTAEGGRAGVAAALSAPVDLVLLDLVMPDLSGIEVVSALRADERTRAVPILLVTAHELSEADRARLNGDVEAVIAKSADRMQDLVREISRVLRQPARG